MRRLGTQAGTHHNRLARVPLLRQLAEVPLFRRVEPQIQQIAIVPLTELATVMVMVMPLLRRLAMVPQLQLATVMVVPACGYPTHGYAQVAPLHKPAGNQWQPVRWQP